MCDHARHHLHKPGEDISLTNVLGTKAGLEGLAKFLKKTMAFKKTTLEHDEERGPLGHAVDASGPPAISIAHPFLPISPSLSVIPRLVSYSYISSVLVS